MVSTAAWLFNLMSELYGKRKKWKLINVMPVRQQREKKKEEKETN